MSCFSCMSPRRKDVRDYDEDMVPRSVDVSVKRKAYAVRNENGGQSGSLRSKDNSRKGNVARSFTFKDLAMATQNFREANLIGEGGFGCVYKGRLDSGMIVAIKQLNLEGLQGNQEFIVEVLMLSLLHHENLVNLIGYCTDGDQRLLVYEYMPLGSLENHLLEPLSWSTRLKIAVGAARGLQYLHVKANPPVIYRDLKSSNILLDNDFNPKLSDFGLAKLGPVGDKTHVSTRFGVVLLELITGRKAIDCTRKPGEQNLVVWSRPFLKDRRKFVQMVDPLLEGCFPVRCLHHAVAIAAMCLQEQPSFRPIIDDIVVALEYLASQADSSDSHKGLSYNEVATSPPRLDVIPDPRKQDFVNFSAAF